MELCGKLREKGSEREKELEKERKREKEKKFPGLLISPSCSDRRVRVTGLGRPLGPRPPAPLRREKRGEARQRERAPV